jgi:hypothetical protein
MSSWTVVAHGVGWAPVGFLAGISFDGDTIAAAAAVISVPIAVVAAIVGYRSWIEAKKARLEASLPRLTTTTAPTITQQSSGVLTVDFTARNDGKGTARVVAYAVRDALDRPTRAARYAVLSNAADKSQSRFEVAPETYGEFHLDVPPDSEWFHTIISKRASWAIEVVYTNLAAEEQTCTRFGVEAGSVDSGWSLMVPRHERSSL